ncbi:hypothetical protein F373_gp019 [Bacillus phage SP-10]|uniref:hypothetical protein n=1 Tax=Bacillus phage SP10 TaxID=941058 RepID=UPI0002198AE7|nr:hypothetical protein F373_gp019 [Bacillus phage SP-10]BAK52831.1 hypothetical protein [Bacillus phage SP-10]
MNEEQQERMEKRLIRIFEGVDGTTRASHYNSPGNGISHVYYPGHGFLNLEVNDSGRVSQVTLGYENKDYVKALVQALTALSDELDREDLKRKETLSKLKERVYTLYKRCLANDIQLSAEELDLLLYTMVAEDFGGTSDTSITFVIFNKLQELFKRYEEGEESK